MRHFEKDIRWNRKDFANSYPTAVSRLEKVQAKMEKDPANHTNCPIFALWIENIRESSRQVHMMSRTFQNRIFELICSWTEVLDVLISHDGSFNMARQPITWCQRWQNFVSACSTAAATIWHSTHHHIFNDTLSHLQTTLYMVPSLVSWMTSNVAIYFNIPYPET